MRNVHCVSCGRPAPGADIRPYAVRAAHLIALGWSKIGPDWHCTCIRADGDV